MPEPGPWAQALNDLNPLVLILLFGSVLLLGWWFKPVITQRIGTGKPAHPAEINFDKLVKLSEEHNDYFEKNIQLFQNMGHLVDKLVAVNVEMLGVLREIEKTLIRGSK